MRKETFTLSSTSCSSTTLGGDTTGTGDFSLTGSGFEGFNTVAGAVAGVVAGVGVDMGVGAGTVFEVGVEVEVEEDIMMIFV